MQRAARLLGFATIALLGLAPPGFAQNGKNPPGVDRTHYQCYSVDAEGNDSVKTAKLRDQFSVPSDAVITKPVLLCAPATKNDISPTRDKARTHYLCYTDDRVNAKLPRTAIVTNQFTNQDGIKVRVEKPVMLCVPSLKRLLPP